MIEIDGNYGSGGGQVLRTAVGLACLTGKACKISNIRAKKRNPGILEQHLRAVRSVSNLCSGKIEGAEIGSREVMFTPGNTMKKEVVVKVATSGSVGLVLQSLLIATSNSEVKIKIIGGGTWGKWAPPIEYIENVLHSFLADMGYKFEIKVLREGFFPEGGAEVEVDTHPAEWKTLDAVQRGGILSLGGISVASISLKEKRVAERQVEAAQKLLYEHYRQLPTIDINYSPTMCPGSGLQLWIDTEYMLRIGADAVGERGRRAEDVGRDAARKLIREYEGGGIDSFAADQVLPYLALAGGKVKVNKVSEHVTTNIFVIEKFLDVKFKIENNIIEIIK